MRTTKQHIDYTVKQDRHKLRLTLVPTRIVEAIASVRQYGVQKYGDSDAWMRVEMWRYQDAAYRHWLAYLRDPHGRDDESGLPHLWHLATNIAFLCELDGRDKSEAQDGRRI